MSPDSSDAGADASLQDRYGPHTKCFGCGPANPQGLRIKSRVRGDEVVAVWTPEPHHEAFPGVLNGGIIGVLIDCHSNWAAAYYLMTRRQASEPPFTVTAEFHVRLRRPTPSGRPVTVRAHLVDATDDRATIAATVEVDGVETASGGGTFVAVKPDHPGFNRW